MVIRRQAVFQLAFTILVKPNHWFVPSKFYLIEIKPQLKFSVNHSWYGLVKSWERISSCEYHSFLLKVTKYWQSSSMPKYSISIKYLWMLSLWRFFSTYIAQNRCFLSQAPNAILLRMKDKSFSLPCLPHWVRVMSSWLATKQGVLRRACSSHCSEKVRPRGCSTEVVSNTMKDKSGHQSLFV